VSLIKTKAEKRAIAAESVSRSSHRVQLSLSLSLSLSFFSFVLNSPNAIEPKRKNTGCHTILGCPNWAV